ncbi:MAG TPA: YggS family pyridoxal phosphate-dependent enzyme [Actinomycetota bacterium]|nr:YggS family pyridoxal phosphate-dependent enzyme [Actinomycetota bacterium]
MERAVGAVRERIARACRLSGRKDDEVRLIAVTKGVPPERIALAARAGVSEFGENYVQDLVIKKDRVPGATWHFVGRLQRNKIPRILDAADLVQTLEPGGAADRLAALAEERGRRMECLVEVDFAGGRVGVPFTEAESFVERAQTLRGLRVRGLMAVAPLGEDPRPSFARLRELRDVLRSRFEDLTELSMGMSADLEAAVQEGATMVRIGTAIFGARTGNQVAGG